MCSPVMSQSPPDELLVEQSSQSSRSGIHGLHGRANNNRNVQGERDLTTSLGGRMPRWTACRLCVACRAVAACSYYKRICLSLSLSLSLYTKLLPLLSRHVPRTSVVLLGMFRIPCSSLYAPSSATRTPSVPLSPSFVSSDHAVCRSCCCIIGPSRRGKKKTGPPPPLSRWSEPLLSISLCRLAQRMRRQMDVQLRRLHHHTLEAQQSTIRVDGWMNACSHVCMDTHR
jgi:hypothetical protein